MEKRLTDAIKIRDTAMTKLRAEGKFKPVKNSIPVIAWENPNILVFMRSPFQKMLPLEGAKLKAFHDMSQLPIEPLPWGLDIWVGRKVMSIEWNDTGGVHIGSFKRGEWEEEVLRWSDTEKPDDEPDGNVLPIR